MGIVPGMASDDYSSPILREFRDCGRANSYDLKRVKPSNRVYVAGSIKNMQRCRDIMGAIEFAGGTVKYDWTRENQDKLLTDFDYKQQVIKNQLQEVARSDFFVLVAPGGRGSYVELGVALSNNIKCYILLDPNDKEEVLVHSSSEVNQVFSLLCLLDSIQREINDSEQSKKDEDIPF